MANWAALKEKEISLPVYKRAKHGIHFQRSDGQIQAEFVVKPCHYFDSGLWQPIDTKLIAKGNGFYGCPHSDVIVHPDGRVAVEGTDYAQYTALPGAPTGKLDNDRIVREFTGGRQYLYITESGFRQEIVLDKIPSLTITNAKKLLATVSGGLSLKYVASHLTATDADGDTYTYDNLTNLRAWLTAAKYPVVIDPDFNVQPDPTAGKDTIINQGAANDNYGVMTSILIRGDSGSLCRGLIKFDVSSIGSGSTITSGVFSLYRYASNGATDQDIKAHRGLVAWLEGTKNSATAGAGEPCWNYREYNTTAWGSAGGAAGTDYETTATDTTTVSNSSAFFDWDITADVAAWVAGTATNHGNWIIHNNEGTTLYKRFYSSDYTDNTSLRPKLAVTYTAGGIAIPVAQYYYNRLRRN